jgi:hypothetical protein
MTQNNIIYMKSRSDWFVMNMVKQHIANLKKLPQDADTIEAISRNEAALRSFFDDIKERSQQLAA